MHNAVAHHPMNATQPVPKQRSLPLASSHGWHAERDAVWYRTARGPVWVGCPGCVLAVSRLPACPAARSVWAAEKSLTA